MVTIALVLLIAAFLCFAMAAFVRSAPPYPVLVPLGLALWVLSLLIDRIKW